MKIKRWMILIGVLFIITSCTPQKKEKAIVIRVSYWGDPTEVAMNTRLARAFEKEHPNIKIKLEHSPWDRHQSKLLTQIAGGVTPDVILCSGNEFPVFYEKKVLLDLMPFIEKDDEVNLNQFYRRLIEFYTIDGALYILPRSVYPIAGLYYNKSLFDKAGIAYPNYSWDWDDLVNAAKKLTLKENGKIVQYGLEADWEHIVSSNGGGFVDNNRNPTRCTMDDPRVIEALQFTYDLMYKYKVMRPYAEMMSMQVGSKDMFMTNRVAMVLSSTWPIPIYRTIKNFEWDVALFPQGPSGTRKYLLTVSGYSIARTTKHPAESWEVLKWMGGAASQIELAEAGRALPAIIDIAKGPHWAKSLKLPRNKKIFVDAMEYAEFWPFTSKWAEIWELAIRPEMELFFSNRQSLEETVNKIIPKVNNFLEKSRR